MSAPVLCGKCRYKWDLNDKWAPDGVPCDYCKEYDAENEIYTDFAQFAPLTNEDRVKNMFRMDTDELAALLHDLNPHHTTYDWFQWLREKS